MSRSGCSLMAVWTTRSPRGTNARVSHMKHDAATSTIVAHGLRSNVSVRRPGIRTSRSRRRWRRGLGSEIVPSRSIFGARLRSRVPQYGHSVMYGDTSEPQFLQTTNRSGPVATGSILCGRQLGPRGFHDLGHDLAQVVVGLVDDDLALGPAAALDEVLDAGEVGLRTDLLGVLAQAVELAARKVAGTDLLAGGQVDKLTGQSVASGQPLVLVEDLPRQVGQVRRGAESLGELVDHRLDQRGEGERVLDAGLRVADADLDRAELRVRPHVVPEVGVVGHHAGVDHERDLAVVVGPVAVVGRDADAREGAEDW